MINKKNAIVFFSTGIFLLLTWYLGFQIDRTQFFYLITHYGFFFLLYLVVYHYSSDHKTILWYTGVGVGLRFLLIFAFPNLSDDVYRFIWDGRLIANGINPFDHLPTYYIEEGVNISGISTALYEQLNSPNYFTIYPPVNQFIFATAAYLFPNSIIGSSIVMKSYLFLMEVGSLYLIFQLLRHFQLPEKNILLYALNPLIIFEIMGNIHFEGAMIFFLLLSVWLIAIKQQLVGSAIAMALAIASKLLPLIFLPFFILRLSNKLVEQPSKSRIIAWFQRIDWLKNLLFFGVLGISLLLLFLPLFSGSFLANFGASLNLYFQKFEFNGSISYLLRWLGYKYKGYNIIQSLGPSLSILAFLSILYLMFREQTPRWNNLFKQLLFAICAYLFLSMTVHPWYVALPIVCCLFTPFRFPILWSGLIFLTYINYNYVAYQENLWMVAIEYILIGIFVGYEFFFNDELEMMNDE